MTKGEIQTIRNIVARMREPNMGCNGNPEEDRNRLEVSRIYLDTWLLAPLEMLLPGEERNVDLAESMSAK